MSNLTQRPLTVLVVDDDPIGRFIHSKMLALTGHQIVQAENGDQAVTLSKEKSLDVILMDINMPMMDGLQATQKIREQEKSDNTHPVYIIGVTGQGDMECDNCLANGMDIVVSKPVRREHLVSLLQDVSMKVC
jgi:CheY-like chemotaxis protein